MPRRDGSAPRQVRAASNLQEVLLVDPSLFTAPYDAALSDGLELANITPRWATRALRGGEEDELGVERRLPIFYRWTDGPRRRTGAAWRAVKGIEHLFGMRELARMARDRRAECVHFQWAVLPTIDAYVIQQIRKYVPVVLTVHDTTPFNGKSVARAQVDGFDRVLRSVDWLIVHTQHGRDRLIANGLDAGRITVVPHGLLGLPAPRGQAAARTSGARWRVVQFGKIQDYKGVDLLVEALGLLAPAERSRLAMIVAGEPLIDLAPLRARATALGLKKADLVFRPHRHSQSEMDAVLAEADAFVFPYRAIEASGVLFLVARLGKWIIASNLGAFAEMLGRDNRAGALVPAGDAAALASALLDSIGRAPTRDAAAGVPDWAQIGAITRDVYAEAASSWRADRARLM